MNKWHLDSVNGEFKMMRIKGNAVEDRDLHWWERPRYYLEIRRRARAPDKKVPWIKFNEDMGNYKEEVNKWM